MGAAIQIVGSDNTIEGSVITVDGNCGSNVTPLLAIVSANRTLIQNTAFHYGCTLYSMDSVIGVLWEFNTANYRGGSRGGTVRISIEI
jgi:hypothetical protein